jgi:beta-lactamase class D
MKILFLLALVSLTACTSKNQTPDKDVCFILYDLKKNKFEEIVGEQRCEQRLPAGSTFKVPLSVMAYDSGILKSEDRPIFEWNKVPTVIAPWNKDHNPTSWMRDSVVWVSQIMTAKIGIEKIQNYLKDFTYGNQDFSAGLKYSWLTPAPFITEPMQNSLKISGHEQVAFLSKLWRSQLPASKSAQELTRKIMTHDQSPKGSILIGKTGSGFTDSKFEIRLGWFIGHLRTEKTDYIVVSNFSDKQKQTAPSFGGREAKEMALKFLSDKGYW